MSTAELKSAEGKWFPLKLICSAIVLDQDANVLRKLFLLISKFVRNMSNVLKSSFSGMGNKYVVAISKTDTYFIHRSC